MADKLGKLMQALETGKTQESLAAQPKAGLLGALKTQKTDVKHTWKANAFSIVGTPRAKKRGSGKH